MIFTERRGGGGSGAKNIILEHPTKAETETMDCVSSDLKKKWFVLETNRIYTLTRLNGRYGTAGDQFVC